MPRHSGSRVLALLILLAVVLFAPAVALRFALPALSPFIAICAVLATRTVGIALLCGAPMLVFVAIRRRGFCRFFCPVGWLLELCAKVSRSTPDSYARLPRVGRWVALITLGGAILSVPFLLALDPLAMCASALGTLDMPLSRASIPAAAGFVLLIVSGFVVPHLWCAKLCPLGGTQEVIADLKQAAMRRRGTKTASPRSSKLVRRDFLGLIAGVALAAPVSAPVMASPRPIPLRPPGAVGEGKLAALCIRCGNCVRSCPTGIIQADLTPPNLGAFLTPIVRFNGQSCLDDCNRCGRHCPTGAITALPVEEKNERRIGLAVITIEACLLTVGRECSACSLICQRGAIVEAFCKETYSVTPRVDPMRCNGCGACMAVCPPQAIAIRKA
ncbi:MAG TPA: 4Fe-4S binding protein [Candidatus Hydrogenedentes bacterium]|nr:4Fe-4S binding protein [Candidatus Hydrogenedentota bacterium]HPG66952.1 4Fe-4S binding protein [Candidatus Hydrogenedentota bacterium]